jgi:peptidase M28-like protein
MSVNTNRFHISSTLIAATGLALTIAGCESTPNILGSNNAQSSYAIIDGKQVDVPDIEMADSRSNRAIINEGKNNSQVMDILSVYAVEYGPRLTGSTRLQKAQRWATDSFQSWGLEDSRMEQYGTLATRFDRGPSTGKIFSTSIDKDGERKEMRSLEFSTLSWSPGTDGPVSGHVAYLPTTMSEYNANQGSYAGSWVMIEPDYGGRGGIRSTGYMMRDRFDERHEIRNGTHKSVQQIDTQTASENTWEGSFDYNGSKIPATFSIDESGDSITGNMSIEGFAEGPIENASRDGDTLSFKWTHSMGTSNISMTFDGDSAAGVSVSSSGKEYPIEFSHSDSSAISEEERIEQDRVEALAAVLAENPAGFVSSSKDERVWTTSANNWRERELKDYPVDAEVNIRQSDFDFITARLSEGLDIEVEFDLDHTLTAGPFPLYNVIADIPGTKYPEQVVIISAHIDSWDGPGSMGAVDNATGSAVVTEAARIIMESGVRPERTIRIALWGGEEQGLLGSKAYVKTLSEEELSNISAAFVDDGGTNYQGGMPAADYMVEYLATASSPTNGVFFSKTDYDAAMNDDDPDNDELAGFMNVNVRPTGGEIVTHSGSDHASFIRAGVPGFFWDETGRANYRHSWHTQNDRYDEAIEEYLVQSATNMAIVAFNLANAPDLLPRDGLIYSDEATIERNLEPIGSAHNCFHDDLEEDNHDQDDHQHDH